MLGESNLSELIKPPPWLIKLNQWRNIAQHYSYDVIDDIIVCKYGKFPKQKEIRLYKNELWLLCIKLFEIIGILKVSHSIFFLDNNTNCTNLMPEFKKRIRKESKLLDVFSALAIRGFEVINNEQFQNRTKFILRDLTRSDLNDRQIHVLNLVYPLWYNPRTKHLEIEFRDIDNKPIFLVKIDTTSNPEIFKDDLKIGELELKNLMKTTEIIDLTNLKK